MFNLYVNTFFVNLGMAKAAKKKATPPKPRADKYDEKLAINGNFADVFKVIKKNKEEKKEKNN